MTRPRSLVGAALLTALLVGCSSDEGSALDGGSRRDGTSVGSDGQSQVDTHGPGGIDHGLVPDPDQGTGPGPDGAPAADGPPVAGGALGSVCTQENRACAEGLRCVFLEAWDAPKGTCVRELADGCQSWDDPRCATAGANYSVMCGPYTENAVSTHICFLLCEFNGTPYDCPPGHGCKPLKGYEVCVPQ